MPRCNERCREVDHKCSPKATGKFSTATGQRSLDVGGPEHTKEDGERRLEHSTPPNKL